MSWTRAWLPRHLRERGAPLPPPGAEEVFEGTLARVDIPGFTARAERLGERVASEALAQIVEETFGPVLTAVDARGGSVAGLEGDAVLALFSGAGHAARGRAALSEILGSRPALHAAVATGEIRALHLGDEVQRVEILHGPALAALERAEARRDHVVAVDEPVEPVPATTGPGLADEDLAGFVPPELRGDAPLTAAHRRVVACFLELPLDRARDGWRVVSDEAESHAVTILKARAHENALLVLALTGAPVTRENDRTRALQFAVAVRDRLADEVAIRPRMALTEGTVLALVIGNVVRASYDVFGDIVNVAARVVGEARPGEILVTATLVDDPSEWRLGPVRSLVVRGKVRPVPVRALEGPALVARARPDPAYVRPRELARLRTMLAEPGGVVVVGAPGMGKRQLWQQFTTTFGGRVLRVSCHDYGAVRPLAPFVGLLRRLAEGTQTRAGVLAALAAQPGMTDRSVAALSALIGSGSPQIANVYGALRQLLAGAAAVGPTLLVVEDWQWADTDTRELVERLIPDLARTGLRLVLTTRPRTTVPDVFPRIDLPPLDRATARALVERIGGGELGEALVDEIVGRGAGNPRDLVALAEAARQGGDELPSSLEAWYAARLDRLSPAARDVLERAAVVGRTVERGVLRRLAADVPGAEEGLQELLRERLLVATEGSDRLQFEREPMREIVYMRLPSERRRRLHGRYGRTLQNRIDVGEAVAPETVAWHLARSDRPEDAIDALVEASRRALAHGRPRLAVSHAEQASRLAHQAAPERLGAVQRQLGDAMLKAGRADLALEAFRAAGDRGLATNLAAAFIEGGHAREALAAVGQDRTPAAAAVRARALALLGDPDAERSWAEALSLAEDPGDRARALRFYGADLARNDRHREAIDVLAAAVQSARHARDILGRAEAEEMLGRSLTVVGRLDEALAVLRTAFATREAQRDPEGSASALRSLARAESLAGDAPAALGHLLAARGILRDLGLESRLLRLEVDLAEIRLRRGEPDRARQHLARAGDLVGRARARHALLVAGIERTLPLAEAALVVCTGDRWRAGAALAEALVVALGGRGDQARALATLEEIPHVEFLRLARSV